MMDFLLLLHLEEDKYCLCNDLESPSFSSLFWDLNKVSWLKKIEAFLILQVN